MLFFRSYISHIVRYIWAIVFSFEKLSLPGCYIFKSVFCEDSLDKYHLLFLSPYLMSNVVKSMYKCVISPDQCHFMICMKLIGKF